MQRQDDSSDGKAREEDDGTKLTTRRRGGSGLDSIVSGLREQEDRRQRSTPRSGNEDPTAS